MTAEKFDLTAKNLMKRLNDVADPVGAEHSQKFFKTYKGGYAEGDVFLGLTVPTVRNITKDFIEMSLAEIEKLLDSPIHEHRFAGLVILVKRAKKATEQELKVLYNFYLNNTSRINNWDLVDVSVRDIVGKYLFDKSRKPLYELALSENLWERRISIVATAYFIGKNDLQDTFKISALLIKDNHDLIHKACGWMLREAGKRDEKALKLFLDNYASVMPRTMLRYSLEKLHQSDRQYYMQLKS